MFYGDSKYAFILYNRMLCMCVSVCLSVCLLSACLSVCLPVCVAVQKNNLFIVHQVLSNSILYKIV